MIVTTNRELAISRATEVAREEVIIMVATMAAIINVGEGMINPVWWPTRDLLLPWIFTVDSDRARTIPTPTFQNDTPAYTSIDIKCNRRLYFLKKSAHPRLTILSRLTKEMKKLCPD